MNKKFLTARAGESNVCNGCIFRGRINPMTFHVRKCLLDTKKSLSPCCADIEDIRGLIESVEGVLAQTFAKGGKQGKFSEAAALSEILEQMSCRKKV